MGRCGCILATGPKKGSRCSNRAKFGSKFCGIHVNCQIMFQRAVENPSDALRRGSDFEVCPEALRPIDGLCPPKFPKQRLLPDGSVCCWRKFKTLRKNKLTRQTTVTSSPDISRSVGPCMLNDYKMTYYPSDEIVPVRHLDFSGYDCQSYNQDLMRELPSSSWIMAQREYIAGLSIADLDVIKFYTYHGDVILNNFIRHGWTITVNDLDYIRLYYDEGAVSRVFMEWMQTLNLTAESPVERILIAIYNQLNRIIMESPINPQRFVSYRGSQTKDYFDQTQMIFQTVGFFSTTLLVGNAIKFSKEKFMTRIVVPKGYHCLYLESASRFTGEYEILMPDQTQYVITSKFREQRYGYGGDIPTNELVMVKAVPKQLTASSIPTVSTPIRDLIVDLRVREEVKVIISAGLGLYSDTHDSTFYQLVKIWLRRLADHQIYTLETFLERGQKLRPTVYQIMTS